MELWEILEGIIIQASRATGEQYLMPTHYANVCAYIMYKITFT